MSQKQYEYPEIITLIQALKNPQQEIQVAAAITKYKGGIFITPQTQVLWYASEKKEKIIILNELQNLIIELMHTSMQFAGHTRIAITTNYIARHFI